MYNWGGLPGRDVHRSGTRAASTQAAGPPAKRLSLPPARRLLLLKLTASATVALWRSSDVPEGRSRVLGRAPALEAGNTLAHVDPGVVACLTMTPVEASVPRSRRVLRLIAYAVIAVFLMWTVQDLAMRWHASPPVKVHAGWLLSALLPLLAASLLQAWAWLKLVDAMDESSSLRARPALQAYLLAQLARYTPGKLGMPAVLIARAGALGVSGALLAMSVVVATGLYVVCGLVMGAVSVAWGATQGEDPLQRWMGPFAVPLLTASVIGLLLATIVDRRWLPAFLRRFAGTRRSGPLLPLKVIALMVAVWLAWLLHGALLLLALGADGPAALQAAGYFVVAPVAGVLALVVPGGLGVREAVVTAGVAPGVGAASAVVAALLSRVLSVGADVFTWLALQVRWPALRRR